jgi:benzoyl-CoA reductase subunit C
MTSRIPYDHERELELVLERCHPASRDAAIPADGELPEGFTGTLGHFPVYFPEEIAHAAGLLPVNVLGGGNRLEIKHADARMGSFVCSICRSTT